MTRPRPSAEPRLVFRPLTAERWEDLERLFGENGACEGCWCMFWHQTGTEHRAARGERNRRAFRRMVRSGVEPGLLAYAGAEPVGWVAVQPRSAYSRLAASPTLRPPDALPVWSTPCFYVTRGWRRSGLAARLLAAAAAHARRRGARILEGYPVDADRPLASGSLYHGASSTFARLGFEEVARRAPTRPVMRLRLRR
jgi:GNAT superfamily N-acetyltransferase